MTRPSIKEIRKNLNNYVNKNRLEGLPNEEMYTKTATVFYTKRFIVHIESKDCTYFISISTKRNELITAYKHRNLLHVLNVVEKCINTFLINTTIDKKPVFDKRELEFLFKGLEDLINKESFNV